jgi:chorismate mutase
MAANASEKAALDKLRQEIDEIDDQIHDLLMRRTSVVHGVAQIKNEWIKRDGGKLDNDGHPVPSLAMRPEREASIFRRLKARHSGGLPFHVIVQLWRELINAKTRLQGPLAISLYHGDETILPYGSRDLARAAYGAATTLNEREAPFDVLDDVMKIPGVIGVLPEPVTGERAPWWPQLLDFDDLAAEHGTPRVIAKLPCVVGEASAPTYPVAFTIACFDQMDSGDDTSFFILGGSDASDEAIGAAFKTAGIQASVRDHSGGLALIETTAFVDHEDTRLGDLGKTLSAHFLRHVGGFANPVEAGEG